MKKKGGEGWEATIKVPMTEDVVHYRYVVMSGQWREEAKVYKRSISLVGLADGDEIDVQDSFRLLPHPHSGSRTFSAPKRIEAHKPSVRSPQ